MPCRPKDMDSAARRQASVYMRPDESLPISSSFLDSCGFSSAELPTHSLFLSRVYVNKHTRLSCPVALHRGCLAAAAHAPSTGE